jgi:cytochrome c
MKPYQIPLLLLLAACGKDAKNVKEPVVYESEAKKPAQHGEELFNGIGKCYACHQPDQKILAPSLQEIAEIYKEKGSDMVSFLRGEGKPIVDPSQYQLMLPNIEVTKTLSDAELQALEAYVMTFASQP